MKRATTVLTILALVAWGRTAIYTVDYAEFVYVTRFGERVALHDGETAAGIKIKAPWPIDAVQRIDRRVQSIDLPAIESLTRDPVSRTVDKTLSVDAFVTWRVVDPERFVRARMTPEQVKKVLAPLINGRLAAVISTMPLDELISVIDTGSALAGVAGTAAAAVLEPELRELDLELIEARVDRIESRLLGEDGPPADQLRRRARAEYGIEVIDVRVRRFSYPEAVRREIAERIRSERGRKVAIYESEGRARANRITTDANTEARQIEDRATADKLAIEGEAKAAAIKIRGAAYAEDRAFGTFMEQLQAFQATVAETRDLLLLSTEHPLYRLIKGPPAPPK